jgi:hypothetical protein
MAYFDQFYRPNQRKLLNESNLLISVCCVNCRFFALNHLDMFLSSLLISMSVKSFPALSAELSSANKNVLRLVALWKSLIHVDLKKVGPDMLPCMTDISTGEGPE